MTRTIRPRKFDWSDPSSYVDDDPPSGPDNPAGAANAASVIPFITGDVPAQTDIRGLLDQPGRFPDWPPPADRIPYIEYGWPPKPPYIEAPPPARPPTRLFGPTPSRIADSGPAAAVDGRTGRPASTGQSLTVQALRMKGVPDTDIVAAVNDPAHMKVLLNRLYGGGQTTAPGDDESGFAGSAGRG
jgi:hypothetical protein